VSYEYVCKSEDATWEEAARVMRELEARGFKPLAVRFKPETRSVVVYFDRRLGDEEKAKLDKAMAELGYMVVP